MKRYKLEQLCIANLYKKVQTETTVDGCIYEGKPLNIFAIFETKAFRNADHTSDDKVTAIDGIRYYKSFRTCNAPEYYATNIRSLAAVWSQDKTFEEIVKILKTKTKFTLIELLAIQEYLSVGKR